MTMRLEGKVALISGGARGMGAAEARLFVDEGASVVLGDVLDAEGEAVAKELGDSGHFVHLDVRSETEWTEAVATAVDRYGGLDVLVNNAGIGGLPLPMAMLPLDDYRAVIEVNQVGVFLGMKTATPAVAARGGGSIVNISSLAGLTGSVGLFAYTASKFAVRGMTKAAAMELASAGIRVNSVHPGIIDTPILDPGRAMGIDFEELSRETPRGRIGTPDDVARLVLFLASDESDYCTGAEFVVDGGILAGVNALIPRSMRPGGAG